MSPRRHVSVRALSLVEILVSFAIVSILAVLITPAINRFVTKSNQAKAAADLRQVHLAVLGYAQDNDGTLPGPGPSAAASGFTKTDLKLARFIAPYLMDVDFSKASNNEQFRLRQLEPAEYYRKKVQPATVRAVAYQVATDAFTDPDYSHPFGSSSAVPPISPKRLITVPEPSRNPMLLELDQKNVEGKPGWKSELPKEPLYGTTRLVLFWDGHIGYSPVED